MRVLDILRPPLVAIDAGTATTRISWGSGEVHAPTDASAQDCEALVEAVAVGGASVVAIVPEPLAAAVGAGLDVSSEYATPILDAVTDVAILAMP